uniref:Uncharacterized protein n=1 Tax=Arundo donax TaxID=35708 RepID=A0A0A9HQM9_ARUDO
MADMGPRNSTWFLPQLEIAKRIAYVACA